MDPDDRKAAILRVLVEEYIQTGQPVGSSHVARAEAVRVSSATVRNDMVALEAEGFVHQPHTSAGRVPTEKGYRFFVDNLDAPTDLAAGPATRVSEFFAHAHGQIEHMLQETSHLLSELTQQTAVVVGPDVEAATILSVQVVSLGARQVLLVVVLSNGAVHKESFEVGFDVTGEDCEAASAELRSLLVGETPGARVARPDIADQAVAALVELAVQLLAQPSDSGEQVFVDGASRLASSFEAVEQVSKVLTILEHQLIVVSLLRDVIDRGMTVAIGSETGVEPLADAAIVVAPYEIEGEPVGTVGVLGPTRMNYPDALAAVAVVSRRLSESLTAGTEG